MGFSHSYIDQIEKGRSKASKKFLEKAIEVFPHYKNKLLKEFFKEEMPGSILEDIKKELAKETQQEMQFEKINLEVTRIPIYGIVSAGSGVYDMENVEFSEMILPKSMQGKGNLFGVKIHGDSMEPRFLDKDILILDDCVPSTEELHNKEVAIEINGERYIKLLKFEDFKPYLYSYSPAYAPIAINGHDDIKILGRLVYLIRDLK